MTKHRFMLFTAVAVLLTGCADGQARYPTGYDRTETGGDIYAKRQSFIGDQGFCFGGSDERAHMRATAPLSFGAAKISLASAIKKAEAQTKGRAFNAGIDKSSRSPIYKIDILKKGKVISVRIDGTTGEVLRP